MRAIIVFALLVLLVSSAISARTSDEISAMMPEDWKNNPPDGAYWNEELGAFVLDPPIPMELPRSMLLNGGEDMLSFDTNLMTMLARGNYAEYAAVTKFAMRTPPCDEGTWILTEVLLGCLNDGTTPDPLDVIVYEHDLDCAVTNGNPYGDGIAPELGRQHFLPASFNGNLGQLAPWQSVLFDYPVPVTGEEFWIVWHHTQTTLSYYTLGFPRDDLTYKDRLRFFENYNPCPIVTPNGYGVWLIRAVGHCAEKAMVDGKIDIKPTSCPNPINPSDLGVISVAIVGTKAPDPEFDVREVDPTTVSLMGAAPVRYVFDDVATPYNGDLCGCHTLGADGIEDLVFKFDCQEVIEAIEATRGALVDDEEFEVVVTWQLHDETWMRGADCFIARLNVHYEPSEGGGGLDSYVGDVGAHGDGQGLQSQVWRSDPGTFALYQNTPNPFGGETTIRFSLPEKGHARLTVYDATGRAVADLVDEELGAGTYSANWQTDVPSGMYFCRLEAGDSRSVIRLTHLR